MCYPKHIEYEWIVPGQEPVIDPEVEDINYEHFIQLTQEVYEMMLELLYVQCENESIVFEISKLRKITNIYNGKDFEPASKSNQSR